MTLEYYPEMKEVRHGKPVFPDNFFHSLKTLSVDKIFKGDIVIPSHVLPYLKSLEGLYVQSCDAVNFIVSCFYPERHHLECPILEDLDVSYCSKFKLFTSEFHSHQEALTEGHLNCNPPSSPIQQPLPFVCFPSLTFSPSFASPSFSLFLLLLCF